MTLSTATIALSLLTQGGGQKVQESRQVSATASPTELAASRPSSAVVDVVELSEEAQRRLSAGSGDDHASPDKSSPEATRTYSNAADDPHQQIADAQYGYDMQVERLARAQRSLAASEASGKASWENADGTMQSYDMGNDDYQMFMEKTRAAVGGLPSIISRAKDFLDSAMARL